LLKQACFKAYFFLLYILFKICNYIKTLQLIKQFCIISGCLLKSLEIYQPKINKNLSQDENAIFQDVITCDKFCLDRVWPNEKLELN